MQRTRLNSILENFSQQSRSFFVNPWRRIALNLIALLLGVFMATAVITTYGQTAGLDLVGGSLMIIFTEAISRLTYRRQQRERRSFWLECFNLFKIGLTYGLFVEAFKVGS